ncbi:ATP-binding cassette domain-containing protein [Agrobacterium sp. CG160-95]
MIFGPSSTGKPTLLKIIAGVYAPSVGTIRCGEVEIDARNQRYLLSMVFAVLQSDRIFGGSILYNITFFDPEPDVR